MAKCDVRDSISFLKIGRYGCGDRKLKKKKKKKKKQGQGSYPEADDERFGFVDQAVESLCYRQNVTTESKCVCEMCVCV